jgi:uncharacterized protein (TIGR02284 family)
MEWRNELNRLNPGLEHRKDGSTMGKVYRSWINLKGKLNVSDEEVCADCVVGEKQAIDQYDEVLADETIDANLRSVAERHLGELVAHIEWLKARSV